MAPETRAVVMEREPPGRDPSMRPGQDGPGNPGHPADSARVQPPSMRPGQDGPGNGCGQYGDADDGAAFNEAGARWPRKHVRKNLW